MLPQKIKDEARENLLEELRREKAAVLTRAGWAVEEVILQLEGIEKEIAEKESRLNFFRKKGVDYEFQHEKRLIYEEINSCIDKFNAVHKKAETQFYYLIVTREALGLRRHEFIKNTYRIPKKKKRYGPMHG